MCTEDSNLLNLSVPQILMRIERADCHNLSLTFHVIYLHCIIFPRD